jgi:uncharacterized membrane protein (DUF2068 family)
MTSFIYREQLHSMTSSGSRVLRLIALFKFFKASILIVTGIGILRLMHNDAATTLDHWFARMGLDPGNRFVDYAISKAANIPPNKIKELGLGSFVYAALFLTEGIGLWTLKQWAEWFTVVITASLIPFEAWELYRHPTAVKVLVLLINLAVVAYLLYRIREERPATQR